VRATLVGRARDDAGSAAPPVRRGIALTVRGRVR
jgi:hypothetical protein